MGSEMCIRDSFHAFDEAGGGADFAEETPPEFASLGALFEWLETSYNDLEPAALVRHPEIAATLSILRTLDSQRCVRMSGSGATCFALFETMDAARAGAATLKTAQPDWWCMATALGGLG